MKVKKKMSVHRFPISFGLHGANSRAEFFLVGITS